MRRMLRPPGRSSRRNGSRRGAKRSVLVLTLLGFLVVAPAGSAYADPWWKSLLNPNSICSPSDPVPERAGIGLGALVHAPGNQQPVTPYNNYEMAGLTWEATDLGCTDYLTIAGNQAANLVFLLVKALDRVTITAYQTAYSPGLLDSLSNAVTNLVTGLKNTFYLTYITPVVLLGVMWLAWHGLVRRRATTSVEGVAWMVLAVTVALVFLNRPADVMRAGNALVTGANCAITKGVAQVNPHVTGQCFTEKADGPTAVSQTANALWMVLVYRPWLAGEFGRGTGQNAGGVAGELARKYGGFDEGSLLWTQALTNKELQRIRSGGEYNAELAAKLMNRKHERWVEIKKDIKNNYPSAYPLFQGRQWDTRLGIAFAALVAAVFAGGLVLLISVALIVLKLGFLLLIATGPFFLLAGIHPGVGRVIAMRWVELLVGTLVKQIVVALALAVLLFGYSVIMAPSSGLSWGVQILLLSLFGVAAFVYRKPFQHLFASVGGGFGGRVVGESAGGNPELENAHRRMAKAAAPTPMRRLGGRLASSTLGGAVAGAVGGRTAARYGSGDGLRDTNDVTPDGAPSEGGTEDGQAGTEAGSAGVRSPGRAAAPPPLDLDTRRRARGVPVSPESATDQDDSDQVRGMPSARETRAWPVRGAFPTSSSFGGAPGPESGNGERGPTRPAKAADGGHPPEGADVFGSTNGDIPPRARGRETPAPAGQRPRSAPLRKAPAVSGSTPVWHRRSGPVRAAGGSAESSGGDGCPTRVANPWEEANGAADHGGENASPPLPFWLRRDGGDGGTR